MQLERMPAGCLWLRRQRVIAALAELAGAGCGGRVESNSLRSLIKPAGQLGKQIGGASGWRAAAGSGGISVRSTEGGGKIGGVALQLASSAAQAVSISLRSEAGKVFGINSLLSEFVSAGLLGSLLF
jgi:hypothetical protein